MYRYIIVWVCVLCSVQLSAKEHVPQIKGVINISISKGTITGDVTITNMPHVADYLILLNAGLNIQYIRNMEDSYSFAYGREHNGDVSYESFGYYLPDNTGKAKFLPKGGLQLSYTGKFPVVADTSKAANGGDWKGNIAFNGYSVRADGMQAAWYPVLYDVEKDKTYYQVTYDLKINCSDCNSIYLNGNKPVPGTSAQFKSEAPMEMMLYAGKYKVRNVDGTFFLNPDIDEMQMKEFGTTTNKFKQYYTQKTNIPYQYNITYINTTPVSKHNAWMFVSYPSIVTIGWGKDGLSGVVEDDTYWGWSFIAHELAHYYFGTYKDFNTPISDIISEGFAEYMSAQVMRNYFPDSVYISIVTKWQKNCQDFEPISIAQIKKEEDMKSGQIYKYNYMPLVITAIEKEIGSDKTWQWIRQLLLSTEEYTDYSYIEKALSETLHDDALLRHITSKYLDTDSSLENTRLKINGK